MSPKPFANEEVLMHKPESCFRMKPWALLFGFVGVLLLATEAYPDAPRITIAPAALAWCRSPEEPSCVTCRLVEGASCTQMTWNPGLGQKAWYNVRSPTCVPSSPRCASCSHADEEELRALLARPGPACDCAQVKIGPDPCMLRHGCPCYCATLPHLSSLCPYKIEPQ